MKAITVQQPWSWCIATGHKKVENRSWTTAYRGPLAIHAGRTVDRDSVPMVTNLLVELGVLPDLTAEVPDRHLAATGVVVAVVDLVDICTNPARCYCGPWAAMGQNHWKLANVRAFAEPFPARGSQGLWNIDCRDPR